MKLMDLERMTLENFLDMQQELDNKIMVEKLNVLPTNENHKKLINQETLAMIVECGEFANALKEFKYWSKKPSESKEIVIGEYVDILFFWLSIGNALKFTAEDIENAYKKKYQENIKRAEGDY